MDRQPPRRRAIVVMGVSGSGKSTVGIALAQHLQLAYLDGDDLHSSHNVDKMRRGQPLTDEDRVPWLAAVSAALGDAIKFPAGVVVACSALKIAYRDRIREHVPGLRFVFLDAPQALIEQRLRLRQHHFMPQSLIASQFAALESPSARETDVVTIPASLPVPEAAEAAMQALGLS